MFSTPKNCSSSERDASQVSRRRFLAELAVTGVGLSALTTSCRVAPPASKMRLACQSNAWPFTSGLNGLVPVLETIKSLDFQGYETSFRNVQEAFSNPKPARTRLEATGLACAGVHVAAPDQYEAETSIPPLDFLRTIADGSSALGVEYFVLSGRGVGEVNGQLDRDALKRKVAAVLEIAQYCHDVGITLAYHNHVDDFLNGGAEVDELLDTGNGLIKAWLCVHNAEFADVKVADYFSKRHEHIAGIHLTNILQTKPDHHPFDGQSLLTEIEKAAWKGWLIIEEERTRERREWPETSAVTKSRQHVRKIFGI